VQHASEAVTAMGRGDDEVRELDLALVVVDPELAVAHELGAQQQTVRNDARCARPALDDLGRHGRAVVRAPRGSLGIGPRPAPDLTGPRALERHEDRTHDRQASRYFTPSSCSIGSMAK
jgi:hypothetical protein